MPKKNSPVRKFSAHRTRRPPAGSAQIHVKKDFNPVIIDRATGRRVKAKKPGKEYDTMFLRPKPHLSGKKVSRRKQVLVQIGHQVRQPTKKELGYFKQANPGLLVTEETYAGRTFYFAAPKSKQA